MEKNRIFIRFNLYIWLNICTATEILLVFCTIDKLLWSLVGFQCGNRLPPM